MNYPAMLFQFREGVISVRYGEVEPITFSRWKFKEIENKVDDILGMHKPAVVTSSVFVSKKAGEIHNNFIWYPVDRFDSENENVLLIEAAKAFRAKTNIKIHECEKELDKLFQAERYLNDIIR